MNEQWNHETAEMTSVLINAQTKRGTEDDEIIKTKLVCDLCASKIDIKTYYECEVHGKTVCHVCATGDHRKEVPFRDAKHCQKHALITSYKWKDCILRKKEARAIEATD